MGAGRRHTVAALGMALLLAHTAAAQQSPPVLSTTPTPPAGSVADPSQMSGLPLQVGDLPPGVLSVRVIRQTFANSLPNQDVLLYVEGASKAQTSTTGPDGRTQFNSLQVGQTVHVQTVVEGETLESQRFQMPERGGVRLMLVAGAGAGAPPAAAPPIAAAASESAPAQTTEAAMIPGGAKTVVAIPLLALMVSIAANALWPRQRRSGAVSRDPRQVGASMRTTEPSPPSPTPARPRGAEADLQARRARTFERLVAIEGERRSHPTPELEAAREALLQELVAMDQALDA